MDDKEVERHVRSHVMWNDQRGILSGLSSSSREKGVVKGGR